MKNLRYISFTGIDDSVDPNQLLEFEEEFVDTSVTWGILISEANFGLRRYPSMKAIEKFVDAGLNSRLHICGSLSRLLNSEDRLPFWLTGLIKEHESNSNIRWDGTVQINATEYNLEKLDERQDNFDSRFVLQWREKDFESADSRFIWLHDLSGGKGMESTEVPIFRHPSKYMYSGNYPGYAGGLNPDNVAATVNKIREANPHTNFFIDMESGIRDEYNNFSFDKCRQVLKALGY